MPVRLPIAAEVEKICRSAHLAKARSLQELLHFVVERRLANRDDTLKEYTIGVEVFGRDEDFDPRVDPIVRVQARNLRKRLDRYYHENESAIRIELPRGCYVPQFHEADGSESHDPPELQQPSIIVLPFANLTGDPSQEFIADGVAEEVIHSLAQLPSVRVVARTSAFSFKGTPIDIAEIGRTVQAEFALEGSLRRQGERLRVTAQLIKTSDGYNVWSQVFDGVDEDILRFQQQIAEAIAELLPPGEDEARPKLRLQSANFASYHAYIQGWRHWYRWNPEGFRAAIESFERSVEADPTNARAYAGLAFAYAVLANFAVVNPLEVAPKAQTAAERAIELDPMSGEALAARATIRSVIDFDWDGAEEDYKRAIRANPNFVGARIGYAQTVLLPQARWDEAIAQAEEAVDLDPLAPGMVQELAATYYFGGRYDEALEQCDHCEQLTEESAYAINLRGWVALGQRDYEQALVDFRRADLPGLPAMFRGGTGLALGFLGQRDEALEAIADLRARPEPSDFWIGCVYDALEEIDEAVAFAERAIENREPQARYLAMDYTNCFGDPRFHALIRRLNLPLPD